MDQNQTTPGELRIIDREFYYVPFWRIEGTYGLTEELRLLQHTMDFMRFKVHLVVNVTNLISVVHIGEYFATIQFSVTSTPADFDTCVKYANELFQADVPKMHVRTIFRIYSDRKPVELVDSDLTECRTYEPCATIKIMLNNDDVLKTLESVIQLFKYFDIVA